MPAGCWQNNVSGYRRDFGGVNFTRLVIDRNPLGRRTAVELSVVEGRITTCKNRTVLLGGAGMEHKIAFGNDLITFHCEKCLDVKRFLNLNEDR